MFEKILVPLDGSKLARQVFPHVVSLARAYHSEVTLIGICEPEESEYGQVCRLYIGGEAEELKKELGEDTGASVKTQVVVGESAGQILKYANQNDIGLIIMASHGRSGIMPWSLGGTVTRVLHQVKMPLTIIRAKDKPDEMAGGGLFRKILVPLDGSQASLKVLPCVVEIARGFDCEVTLLQVISSGRHVHTVGGLDFVRFTDLDMSRMKDKAQSYLDGAKAGFEGTRAKVKAEFKFGDATREVINYIRKSDSSLIAMASHGHSRIERWFHDSISFKILQASEKSVLMISSLGASKYNLSF